MVTGSGLWALGSGSSHHSSVIHLCAQPCSLVMAGEFSSDCRQCYPLRLIVLLGVNLSGHLFPVHRVTAGPASVDIRMCWQMLIIQTLLDRKPLTWRKLAQLLYTWRPKGNVFCNTHYLRRRCPPMTSTDQPSYSVDLPHSVSSRHGPQKTSELLAPVTPWSTFGRY